MDQKVLFSESEGFIPEFLSHLSGIRLHQIIPEYGHLFFHKFNNNIIVFRSVGKIASHTVFNDPSILCPDILRIPGTVLRKIQRAIAKQTIEVLKPGMTGIILTILITEKF